MSTVPDLAAGLGVKRRVVENNLAFFSRLELLDALAILDDGQHLAIFGAGLEITFKHRLRQLLISGIGSLLGCAFPGSAGALALLGESPVEPSLIEFKALVARGVLQEIERHAEGVI